MLAHWATTRAWMLLSAATCCIALLGLVAMPGRSAYAGAALEERQLPMKFQLGRLPAELPRLHQRSRYRHRRDPKRFRCFRARSSAQRRNCRAGFQRRLGQRLDRTRTAVPGARDVDNRRGERAYPQRT